MEKPKSIWIVSGALAVLGVSITGAVVTAWEFAGLYSHGLARFGLASGAITAVAAVWFSKPKKVSQ